jgi:hypothetical protein
MKSYMKFHMKISYEKSKNRETDQFQAAVSRQATHQPCVINYAYQFTDSQTTYENLQINPSAKRH